MPGLTERYGTNFCFSLNFSKVFKKYAVVHDVTYKLYKLNEEKSQSSQKN